MAEKGRNTDYTLGLMRQPVLAAGMSAFLRISQELGVALRLFQKCDDHSWH